MSQIEFISSAGYSFTAALYDPANGYASLATGLAVTHVGNGVYRANTGSVTGIVYMVAMAGVFPVRGYANLSVPGTNGYSWVYDELPEAEAAGNGGGVHSVVVTVASSSGGVVPKCLLTVKNAAETAVIAWALTNNNGQITFQLNPGSYKVIVQPPASQFAPLVAQSLTVGGNNSVTYTLTAQSITPPTVPGIATVRFLVLDGVTPVPGAKVSAELEDSAATVETALILKVKHTGITNSDGVCDLIMVQKASFTRGGVYRVSVTDSSGKRSHERRVSVPNLATLFAEDLLDA